MPLLVDPKRADRVALEAVFRVRAKQRAAEPIDPVLLAEQAGIVPDPWQAKLLRSSASRVLLNCSRQSGKSTTTALLAVHTALYDAGALVVLLAPSMRQSVELFRKCAEVYKSFSRPVSTDAESVQRVELANGSRIISLPGRDDASIRGMSSVRLLIIDEAARVSGELYAAARPMLAVSGGRLVALSTPFGNRGWWYEAWRSEEIWERYEVPATQCPRISPEFLEEERQSLGDWWYRQEYGCEFLDAQSQAFTRAEIDSAFTEEVSTWPL